MRTDSDQTRVRPQGELGEDFETRKDPVRSSNGDQPFVERRGRPDDETDRLTVSVKCGVRGSAAVHKACAGR
jgi:hypothetical protein